MTALELIEKLNSEFGINEWPDTYEVDAETYANVCQYVFDNLPKIRLNGILTMKICLGNHNGILFKNVELILK